MLLRLILIGGIFALTACTTLGPDYQEPDVAWLQDWQPQGYKTVTDQASGNQLDLRFWWQLFNDPVLNRLIDIARQENLQLQIAGLRILESQALLGIAGSSLYPQAQQATGAIGYVNSKGHNGATPTDRESAAAYQTGFNLGWELDFWGRFQRSIESADATFFASVANQQDFQVLLAAQVADLYFAYRTTEMRIEIANSNAAIQKRSFEITERLFKSGQESELDFQQAKTQYLATLSTIPDLQITLARSRNALNLLLGRAPGKIPELTQIADYKLPAVDTEIISEFPASLLLRRPDIRSAAWQVAAQSAQIGIAEADYYPTISLVGSIQLSGSSLAGNPYTDSLGIGPTLRWNIFDYGRIENNVRLQDVRLQQLIENYQQSVLQAAAEVDDAGYSMIKSLEQEKLIAQSNQAASRALDIANTRYKEGYADFQRVLDAQKALFSQEERLLLSQSEGISSLIQLYKGLGGGWTEMPIEEMIPEDVRNTMKARSDWDDLLDTPPDHEASD
ncbi:MAG: efflux transporter outer membrane subunit [Pseudomonadales bacterium]|nr:efflux transporter outer membrane subunit [Pseudomonadales bacterium]